VDTLIRTPDGLGAAGDLEVGDILLSAKIEGFPEGTIQEGMSDQEVNYEKTKFTEEALSWESENPDIQYTTTKIVHLSKSVSKKAVVINEDLFSDTHYVLVKRDGISKFTKATEVLNTDQVFEYKDNGWKDIYLYEIIEAPHEVMTIDTEPYDIFFTEEMLVHDSRNVV
jgi:hypothetical protein